MRLVFYTSLADALLSLLAIVALSAIDTTPGHPGAQKSINHMMLIASGCLIVWIGIAVWMRPRKRAASVPRLLQTLLASFGILYALWVVTVFFG